MQEFKSRYWIDLLEVKAKCTSNPISDAGKGKSHPKVLAISDATGGQFGSEAIPGNKVTFHGKTIFIASMLALFLVSASWFMLAQQIAATAEDYAAVAAEQQESGAAEDESTSLTHS